MALLLNFDVGSNDLQLSPNSNGVYSNCVSFIAGLLSTDDVGGLTIDALTVDENTITAANITIDGAPATFPYTVNFGTNAVFGFEIIPSGTVGNTDIIKFLFDISGGGLYTFEYSITELDIQDSITIANNTLPIDFGTVEVGNTVNPPPFAINNETCIRYSYSWYSDNAEISFAAGGTTLFARSAYYETAYWTPTSDYDLSVYKIFCDTDCGTAQYALAGTSTNPPPPSTGDFFRVLSISNSIGI